MAEVTIRPAATADWPHIARLAGRQPSEGAALARYVQESFDPGLAWVAVETDPTGAAGAAGAPVGTIVAGVTPASPGTAPSQGGDAAGAAREGGIVFVGVAPPERRRGIGRRLLDVALNDLRARSVRRVTADADGTHVEGLALLRRAGFAEVGQTMGLVLPPEAGGALAASPAGGGPTTPPDATLRPLTLDDLPHLSGLLIQLGIERAQEPHDDLPALTPAQLEAWLMRPATLAYALWEADDPATPLGLAWATRRPDDAELRFVGVQEDARRRGYGRALLGALLAGLAGRPLRSRVRDPGEERAFFRSLGFVAEQVTFHLVTELQPGADAPAAPDALHLE